MARWQIRIDSASSVVLTKLSQVVLGEILDVYGITASVTAALGFDYENTDDGITEKVGEDRLSDKTGLLENLGPTFLLISIVTVLLILVSVLVITSKNDSRCGKFITNTRKKILYGMIIRYFLINALKLNFTLINGVRESTDKYLSIGLLALLQLIPSFLIFILAKIDKDLDSEETEQKFGNLYCEFKRGKFAERLNIMAYYWGFFVRRFCFGLLTIFCFDYPILQVAGHIIMTLITAAFILH